MFMPVPPLSPKTFRKTINTEVRGFNLITSRVLGPKTEIG